MKNVYVKQVCVSVFVCVLLLHWVNVTQVDAAGQNGLGISPAIVEVEIEDVSDRKQIEFFLRNNSNNIVNIALQMYDFRPYGENGKIQFMPQLTNDVYQYSLSSFISLETNEIVLEPKQQKTIVATVEDREDLSPGGHYTALMAREVVDAEDNDKTVIQPAVVSTIFVRKVGGARFNLSIKRVDWPTSSIIFRFPSLVSVLFQNAGNIHLVPFGKVTMTDLFGRTIYEGYLNNGSTKVFPESRRYIPITLKKTNWILPISLITLQVYGQDSLKETQYSYEDSFVYINPVVVGGGVIIAVGFVGYLKFIRNRRAKK